VHIIYIFPKIEGREEINLSDLYKEESKEF